MPANASGPQDDFFGTSYIGSSPYASGTTDYLNHLAVLHGIVSSGAGAPSPQGSTPTPFGGNGNTGIMGPPMSSNPALNAQMFNATNAYRYAAQPRPSTTTTTPPGMPPGSDTAHRSNPSFNPNALGNAGGGPGDVSGTNIPPDVAGLRGNLIAYLQGQQTTNNPYTGNFNLGLPYGWSQSFDTSESQVGDVQSQLAGLNGINFGQAGMYGSQAFGAGQQFTNSGANVLGSALGPAQSIAQTGGAPIQQLLSSLSSIQNAGQTNIERNLAQIREQYGAQGLGQGSDVNQALALGATTGQQGIEAQQSSLLSQILQSAAGTQLGGVNALAGIAGQYGQLGTGLGNLGLGAGSLTNNTQGNMISSILGGAGQLNTALTSSASNLSGLANMNQQGNLYTNSQQYQDFLRMQGLPPAIQAALGFSTNYPPANNQPGLGTALGIGGLGAVGSVLSSPGFWAAVSDRNLKTDITPVSAISGKLRTLPIATWKYKGDSVRHIGPMAQDFSETFGVGDGKMLHLVDVMGVLLQSQKELVTAMGV